MLTRYLYMILLLVLPVIIQGRDPGEPKSVFQSSIQGEIKGIKIQIEVREVKVCLHGRTESIYFLCADITNQRDEAKSMLLRYECQGQARTKEIKIAGKQQKLMLIDRYIPKDEINPESTYLFNLVLLEQNR
jgi:hypothetical protein